MLTWKSKQHFKKVLSQRLKQRLEKTQDAFTDITDGTDRLPDKMDEASLASDLGLALRIREREAKLTVKIRAALARLEADTFGLCEECGEEIPLRRLRARPVTTLCIKCKKEEEAEERKRGITSEIAY
jgi:RNA polymerase-binding transcription factor